MRFAYHSSGITANDYQMRDWLTAAKADISVSPGLVVDIGEPRYPYYFGTEILADDRETRGGDRFSIVKATRRKAVLDFNPSNDSAETAAAQAWFLATYGGRVPFIWEEPITKELISVVASVNMATTREQYGIYRMTHLELFEWL